MDNEVVKAGTLTKRGNVRKSWKRRLFRLHRNGQLTYYKDPVKPGLGSIDIKGQCVGLLRSNQYMAEDADDWISVLRNTSDILRRQSSLAVSSEELYQNLQGYTGAQEVEGEDSDQDEISYEDVVKDTEDDSLYATLPESRSQPTADAGVKSCPPLPPRVSTSSERLSLADEVFQMAEELAETLAENDEILYETVPADQDSTIDTEQPETTVIRNPVFTADGIEEGDFYKELDLETSGNLQAELYDDVAISSNDHETKVSVSETQIQEELYHDVTTPAASQQVQDEVCATSDVAMNYEANSLQHAEEIYYAAVVSDHQEVNEQLYGDVTNDSHKVTEELYDDVAVEHQNVTEGLYAVVTNRVKTSALVDQSQSAGEQQQEELYGDVEEVAFASKKHRSGQIHVSSQDHNMEDCEVASTEQVPLPVDSGQLATTAEQKHQPRVKHYPELPTTVGQGLAQYEQEMATSAQVETETVLSISDSTRSPKSATSPVIETVQPTQGQQSPMGVESLEITPGSLSKHAQDLSGEITGVSSAPDVNQGTTSSAVKPHVSAQEAGRKLKKSDKHSSRIQQGGATGLKKDSDLMTTVTAARKAATVWSKSGSRQKERDEKLRHSRAVEEEAARQIAEWKALHNRLFQNREQSARPVDETVETGNKAGKTIEHEKKDAGTKDDKQADGSGQPLAGDVPAKPMPPKKPTTIASVATQLRKKKLTQQALSTKDQVDSYKQEKPSNDGHQQQQHSTEGKSKENNESIQHSAADEAKDYATATKAKPSPNALDDSKHKLKGSGLITNPSTVRPKSAHESPGVSKPLPPAKPRRPLSSYKVQPSTTFRQVNAITSTPNRPNPTSPPSFPAWSPRSGMATAVGLAVEHQKQLAEWQRKRQEALAAEKKRQERWEAEEKHRREEQAKQIRQAQILEADQAKQSRKKYVGSELVQSQHQSAPHLKTTVARERKNVLRREDDLKNCSESVPATVAVLSADGVATMLATTAGNSTIVQTVLSDDSNLQSKVSGACQTAVSASNDMKSTGYTKAIMSLDMSPKTHSFVPSQESGQKQNYESQREASQPIGQKTSSLGELSGSNTGNRPSFEHHLSEVQIKEKKASAQKRAAALSQQLEQPPDDPIGTDAAELGDDNPLMLRKLSVVARGANAMAKALAAARWIDKEIRKLIAEIQNWGSVNSGGKYEVVFGILFEECSTIFEALSGTLKTAKKHGVVQFNGELLLQGVHDTVVVTLLKDTIPDSNADTYTYQQFRACSISVHKRKGKAFGKETQQTSQRKCFICHNTVYPMEYISADNHPMHKKCFKCCDCGKKLDSKYASLNDKFYCMNHYEQKFKQQGGYGGFK